MQQVEFNEALIEEREEHIQEIHAAVVEVNDIFQDLAALVDEQAKDVGGLLCPGLCWCGGWGARFSDVPRPSVSPPQTHWS